MQTSDEEIQKLREHILAEIDLTREMSDTEIRAIVSEKCSIYGKQKFLKLSEQEALEQYLFHSLRKLDVLQELLDDPEITEIMVNGAEHIFYEKRGQLFESDKHFTSKEKLNDVIQQMAGSNNRMVNEASPIVDTRLANGSRVNIVLQPIAIDGSAISIRKFPEQPFVMEDLIRFGAITEEAAEFLKVLVLSGYNIFVSGGTGSGKTTTLYMALQKLSNRKVNIATIEDPVEWNIPRVNQCQVNTVAGLTFERGLRSLLRQDPDIIMVGETRDEETAAISVRAAITGHLVFSTLHTNDAVSSIIRLIDMGVEPYMVANSLVGLVAQRLVRVVCPECGYWDEPTEQEKAFIGPKITRVRRAQGCNSCSHTGYVGRRAIHEILCVDNQMRRMITQRTPMEELRSYATHYLGMESLTDEALKLVADGTTTVEELKKVAYYI